MVIKSAEFNELLNRGVENIYPSKDFLLAKLKKEKVSIYLGIDPTGLTLHLGHVIPLMKLRQLQKLGHKIVLLIGDFTAQIGDPTDKSATRKPLTKEQVLKNCQKYKEQASKLISFDGDNPAELKFNSTWLEKLDFKDVVELAANFTVQQMLERDMFANRMKDGKPISMHEFMYPLMQGYDSVAMNVDGEIGGNDQTFNMLAGRTLMKKMCKDKEKFVITMKILADSSGEKMGKTTGNMITLENSPEEMFGAVMSWTDGMILGGFELLTDVPLAEIKNIKTDLENGVNPRDLKMRLGQEVVKVFFGEKKAKEANEAFIAQFQKKEIPDDIPEYKFEKEIGLLDLMTGNGLAASNGEAGRLIQQNAVRLEDETLNDPTVTVDTSFRGKVLKVGKRRFLKIV